MEQEILDKIIKNYNQGLERKKHYEDLLKKITKLEEDEKIKEYITLKKRLEQVDYKKIIGETDSQILDSTFNSYKYMIDDTNEIYVCLGTFMLDNICDIVNGPSDIRLDRDDSRAEYRIYRNIENNYSEQIPIRKCEEFEKTHKVIIPNTTSIERYYYELQKEFITLAVTEGQEKACKKILNRNKK